MANDRPTHGWTRHGIAVHGTVVDHHRTDTRYQRFNKRAAVWVTKNVGTMTAGWVFTVLAAFILPSLRSFAAVNDLKAMLGGSMDKGDANA